MNNRELAERLGQLFPLEDFNLRVALVSVLKAVMNDGTHETTGKFDFLPNGFRYANAFKAELLNQKALTDVIFPGKNQDQIKEELNGLTMTDTPLMSNIYSMLSKNILLEDVEQLSEVHLAQVEDEISTPAKREFIWQLMSEQDATEVVHKIQEIVELRRELTPIGGITEEELKDSDVVSVATDVLYPIETSSASLVNIPSVIQKIINTNTGRITQDELSMLIYSGLNDKVPPQKRKASIDSLKFIYDQLQKNPNERIEAFQGITNEKHACNAIINKLKTHFEGERIQPVSPSVSQSYRSTVSSLLDEDNLSGKKSGKSEYNP